MKKQKMILGILSGITFLVFPAIYYFCGDPHLSVLHLFYHVLSGIFLTFVFTLVYSLTSSKVSILSGMLFNIMFTTWWEIIYQATTRFNHSQRYYVQWDQVLSDIIGICIAYMIWKLLSKRLSTN